MEQSTTEKSENMPVESMEKEDSNISVKGEHIVTKDVNKETEEKLDPSIEEKEAPDDNVVVSTADDLVTHIIHVEDDPSVNPWTIRMVFLGEYPNKFHALNCF